LILGWVSATRCGDKTVLFGRRVKRILLTDAMPSAALNGTYKIIPDSVNPPYSPTYPKEWGCSSMHMVEVITRVDPKKIKAMFAKGSVPTPFEVTGDRVAFQFMTSQKHTMSYHNACMFDMRVTAPVRYENYFAYTYLHLYNSDTVMILAGREVLGFPEKDCRYGFKDCRCRLFNATSC